MRLLARSVCALALTAALRPADQALTAFHDMPIDHVIGKLGGDPTTQVNVEDWLAARNARGDCS